jgi:hypothetical protein
MAATMYITYAVIVLGVGMIVFATWAIAANRDGEIFWKRTPRRAEPDMARLMAERYVLREVVVDTTEELEALVLPLLRTDPARADSIAGLAVRLHQVLARLEQW